MPRGGARPGTGGARPGAGRPRKLPPVPDAPPRPEFETARAFGIWALNASDAEVGMDQKIRAMQALLALEAKEIGAPKAAAPPPPADADDPDGGIYAPRRVRGFAVVNGDRS